MRFAALALALVAATAVHAQKPAIRSPGDLPTTRFALDAPPSRAFLDAAFLHDALPRLRAEAERVRASYEIQDQALADQLRSGLVSIALLQGRTADARALIAESRAASTKPQLKLMAMLIPDALAAAMDGPAAGRCAAAAGRIATVLGGAADPLLVRADALGTRTQAEVVSEPFLASYLQVEVDPVAAKNGGSVDLRDGLRLATYRSRIDQLVPCREAISAAIRSFAEAHQPRDIWSARQPDAAALAGAKPVVVAVWDSGIDTGLFPGQLAIDPAEPIDGRDNDGNGLVDDWNGPTYDWHGNATLSPVKPASIELAPQLAFQMTLAKGNHDLGYGYDTPEARVFIERARNGSVADQALDTLLWEEVGGRSHGTAVASEIADGAPYVRLFNTNDEPWGDDPRPIVIDEARNARWLAHVRTLGARFRSAGVRVVNISWIYTADEVEEGLLRHGGEADRARAKTRARAMYAATDAALRQLIAECPNTLFVGGAGNSDQSDDILAATPQTIHAPNLIVVGATGTDGTPTGFTTFGRNVGIYAWGQNVPLRVPGGMIDHWQGTSMATPLVVRAAAQMLAVNPKLTPAQLIAGLQATATAGAGGLKLLHPAKSVAWAKLH